MGANGQTSGNITILDEPDNITYVEYIDKHHDCGYNKSNASNMADWRREQVDILIKLLRDNITAYNEKNHRHIQFGISPTGVYKNGDGNVTYDENNTAITNGSDTHSQQHYASYLFCDTLKWCNLGWIDYILPQNYWARNSTNAPFLKILDWWDKVLLYKDYINLYQGIGLYQANKEGYGSWNTDLYELYKDLKDVQNSYRSEGSSIYNFHALRTYKDGEDKISSNQTKNGMKAWTKRVPPVEIKAFGRIDLAAPKNGRFEKGVLSFDKVEDAKFYIIYQYKDEIKFKEDEIIDIVGNPDKNQRIEWKAGNNGDYKYGIRAISYSNTLGKATTDIYYVPPETDSNSSRSSMLSLLALGCLLILLFYRYN